MAEGTTVAVAAGRRSIAATALAAALVLLTACAPAETETQEGNGAVKLDAAQAELTALLDDGQAVIGGDWEALVSGARSCELANGTGAQVSSVRTGPGVEEGTQQQVADELVALFAEAGFELATRDRSTDSGSLVIEGTYPLNGKDAEGRIVQFTVGAGASSLSGYSRCVPGDADAINLERNDPLQD